MSNVIRLKDLLEIVKELEVSEDAIICIENTTYCDLELYKYDRFKARDISHTKALEKNVEYLYIEF